MDAKGDIIQCSKHVNKEIFDAARCHLGAVGIILDVTWQCEKTYKLCCKTKPSTFDKVNKLVLNEVNLGCAVRSTFFILPKDAVSIVFFLFSFHEEETLNLLRFIWVELFINFSGFAPLGVR